MTTIAPENTEEDSTPTRSEALSKVAPAIPSPVYHATVRDIPADERPRERLEKYGAETLSTTDLLAIILRTGTKAENVMELALRLLTKYRGLGGLLNADFAEISNEHGLGLAKTAQLKAALELGKRLLMEQPDRRFQIYSMDDAANLVRVEMMNLDHEEMHILVLNIKNQLVEYVRRYKGTINSSVVRSAEVFRPAVVRNCPHIIVCHNHPSGDPTPSPEDIEITRQFQRAADLLEIELLDHIIIGNPRYVGMKDYMKW